jgi:hypothetical protein
MDSEPPRRSQGFGDEGLDDGGLDAGTHISNALCVIRRAEFLEKYERKSWAGEAKSSFVSRGKVESRRRRDFPARSSNSGPPWKTDQRDFVETLAGGVVRWTEDVMVEFARHGRMVCPPLTMSETFGSNAAKSAAGGSPTIHGVEMRFVMMVAQEWLGQCEGGPGRLEVTISVGQAGACGSDASSAGSRRAARGPG